METLRNFATNVYVPGLYVASFVFALMRKSDMTVGADFYLAKSPSAYRIVSLTAMGSRKRQLTDAVDTTMKINDCLAK